MHFQRENSSKMNFCFFNAYPGFGGLEIQMVKRASDASDLGYSYYILNLIDSKADLLSKKNNLIIENIPNYFSYLDFLSAYKISKILNKHSTDICIVGKTESIGLLALARKFCKKQFKIVLYQQMQSGIIKKDIYHNWVYKNLDAAIVLTNIMKNELCETTIFPKAKIEAIPYGIELEKFNPDNHNRQNLRDKFGLPQDNFIIGCIGRIEEHKGQQILTSAFIKAKLQNSFLVICGSADDKEYFDNLLKEIEVNELQKSFKYIPFIENVNELLACLDVFVMPSNSETFGLVLIEAMASGLSVIGTNSGGVPEIITNKRNGLIFEQKDISTLADLLSFYFKNPDIRKVFSKLARIDALEKYDYNTQRDKFFRFCEKVSS